MDRASVKGARRPEASLKSAREALIEGLTIIDGRGGLDARRIASYSEYRFLPSDLRAVSSVKGTHRQKVRQLASLSALQLIESVARAGSRPQRRAAHRALVKLERAALRAVQS
jgi:hypothetical protein